jgi:hypothetical protein
MKNFILSIVSIVSIVSMFASCGVTNKDESLIGTKQFITDSSFIISTGTDTYKITDTSILKWDNFLFIYNTRDSSDFKRGVFTVYDTHTYYGVGYSSTTIYLTDGKNNLKFEFGKALDGLKIGDKFYCFYKTKSTFKTTQIK